MKVLNDHSGSPVKHWTQGVEFDDKSKEQVTKVARLPFIYKHIAIMPDVHFGMGATIGSVIATKGAVIPAAVGVDIGCGMQAVKTTLTADDLPSDLAELRAAIESAVPHGRTNSGGSGDKGAWPSSDFGEVRAPDSVIERWQDLLRGYEDVCYASPELLKANAMKHLGTLGTGNHFIEICLDESDQVWVMLHSGSRGIGNKIGTYFTKLAKMLAKNWFVDLPDSNLAYLPQATQHFKDYMQAVAWAQRFAKESRKLMMSAALEAVKSLSMDRAWDTRTPFLLIDCHHNYVAKENHFGENVWVTRKGAVRARKGDLGIIPGSMGAKSFIVEGLGNPQSFHSCSHGAGRVMSRTQARKTFSALDHAEATIGVECRKDADVIDETPGSYKDIDAVMAAQTGLVTIKHTLRQVVCVKG